MGPADQAEPGQGEERAPGPGNPSAADGPGPVTDGSAADGPAPAADGPGSAADGPARVTEDPAADDAAAGSTAAGDSPAAAAEPPARHSRTKKILAWTAGSLAVVVLLAAGGAYAVYRHLDGNIHQVNINGMLGSQPVDTHPQAENIVIIGSDSRFGQGKGYGQDLTTDQSDTLMIMHIAANRKWVNVMSIPRDSWVNIPACEMGNGQMASPTTFKINEAFAIGNLDGNNTTLGVTCTIKTLEQDTGIHIDHFVVVNFDGLKNMVNAVGGVKECNTTPIDDPLSGLHLSTGYHLLNGTQALAYVRARYTLGDGSDLERIGRQQAFMSSLVQRVKSKVLDPAAIYSFLDATTKSLTVDNQLGGIRGLYDLAMSVRNLPASQVTFFTLPNYPRSEVDPYDTANVLWTQPEDSTIFQDFQNDVSVTGALGAQAHAIAPSTVSVTVQNGTAQSGLQNTVAGVLHQEGFRVSSTSQSATKTATETVIKYHAGSQPQAQFLESKISGSVIQRVPGTGTALTLVLGSNYGVTVQTSGAKSGSGAVATPTPSPSPSISSRTASQSICAA